MRPHVSWILLLPRFALLTRHAARKSAGPGSVHRAGAAGGLLEAVEVEQLDEAAGARLERVADEQVELLHGRQVELLAEPVHEGCGRDLALHDDGRRAGHAANGGQHLLAQPAERAVV